MVYFLCVSIICLSGYIGHNVAKIYVIRDKFFKEFIELLHYIKNNIKFNQKKIGDIYQDFFSLNNTKYKKEIMMLSGQSSFNKFDISFLKKEEIDCIDNFFKNVGVSDEYIEISKIENMVEMISKYSKVASEKREKNESMVYKISLLVGVVLCILIV